MNIYLTGPSYSPEKWQSLQTKSNFLKSLLPCKMYSPATGLENLSISLRKTKRNLSLEAAAFAVECFRIYDSDVVIMNANGRVPDEGSLFKTALAYSMGKSVILYKNDSRSIFYGLDNSMVSGIGNFCWTSKMKSLPRAIEKAAPCSSTKEIPSHYLRQFIETGKNIEQIFAMHPELCTWLASQGPEPEYPKMFSEILATIESVAAKAMPEFTHVSQGSKAKQSTKKEIPSSDLQKSTKIEKSRSGFPERTYCSGPLFCPEEMETMTAIAEIFEKSGRHVFLPQRDGLEPFLMNQMNSPLSNSIPFRYTHGLFHRAVFSVDIYQIIESCDAFIMNMNGRAPDEGAVVEMAVALWAGKPIAIYKNDLRSPFSGFEHPVFAAASYFYPLIKDPDELPNTLQSIHKYLEKNFPTEKISEKHLARNVHRDIRRGNQVWKILKKIQKLRPENILMKRNQTGA